jgi:hypothetical protein
VQSWEAGDRVPNAAGLAGLIKAFLDVGALSHGHEATDAQELWAAAERETLRTLPPFDANGSLACSPRGNPETLHQRLSRSKPASRSHGPV